MSHVARCIAGLTVSSDLQGEHTERCVSLTRRQTSSSTSRYDIVRARNTGAPLPSLQDDLAPHRTAASSKIRAFERQSSPEAHQRKHALLPFPASTQRSRQLKELRDSRKT